MSDVPPVHEKVQTTVGNTGPEVASGNAKIYDRPEHTGLSPALLVVILLILLILAFVLYRVFVH